MEDFFPQKVIHFFVSPDCNEKEKRRASIKGIKRVLERPVQRACTA